jgi:hypothetical protein
MDARIAKQSRANGMPMARKIKKGRPKKGKD